MLQHKCKLALHILLQQCNVLQQLHCPYHCNNRTAKCVVHLLHKPRKYHMLKRTHVPIKIFFALTGALVVALTTFSHKPPHAPQKFGAFIYSCKGSQLQMLFDAD